MKRRRRDAKRRRETRRAQTLARERKRSKTTKSSDVVDVRRREKTHDIAAVHLYAAIGGEIGVDVGRGRRRGGDAQKLGARDAERTVGFVHERRVDETHRDVDTAVGIVTTTVALDLRHGEKRIQTTNDRFALRRRNRRADHARVDSRPLARRARERERRRISSVNTARGRDVDVIDERARVDEPRPHEI